MNYTKLFLAFCLVFLGIQATALTSQDPVKPILQIEPPDDASWLTKPILQIEPPDDAY